jgi:hypothetical protein
MKAVVSRRCGLAACTELQPAIDAVTNFERKATIRGIPVWRASFSRVKLSVPAITTES